MGTKDMFGSNSEMINLTFVVFKIYMKVTYIIVKSNKKWF